MNAVSQRDSAFLYFSFFVLFDNEQRIETFKKALDQGTTVTGQELWECDLFPQVSWPTLHPYHHIYGQVFDITKPNFFCRAKMSFGGFLV